MPEEQRTPRAEPQDEALVGAASPAGGHATETPAAAAPAPAAALSEGFVSHLRYVLRSMRPRQWTKNLIVYMALLFSIDQEWQASDPS